MDSLNAAFDFNFARAAKGNAWYRKHQAHEEAGPAILSHIIAPLPIFSTSVSALVQFLVEL